MEVTVTPFDQAVRDVFSFADSVASYLNEEGVVRVIAIVPEHTDEVYRQTCEAEDRLRALLTVGVNVSVRTPTGSAVEKMVKTLAPSGRQLVTIDLAGTESMTLAPLLTISTPDGFQPEPSSVKILVLNAMLDLRVVYLAEPTNV